MSHIITHSLLYGLIGPKAAEVWHEPLHNAAERWEIDSLVRVAAFLAQTAHESQGFQRFEENLNYSAEGLRGTFRKYFTVEEARRYAHNPRKIASRVYADRYGNGDEASGDGWTYRARGPIGITFEDNYRACGRALALDLLADPALLIVPRHGAMAAGWFWNMRDCNRYADAGDFEGLTRRINGGTIGLEDRVEWHDKVQVLMA